MSGADICIFVTKSEDDGLHPYDHIFWVKYFHHDNISLNIYQGVLDCAGIESSEIHYVLEPSSPRVTTPTKIDHEVMRPFFAWMPVKRICKTLNALPNSCGCYHPHTSGNVIAPQILLPILFVELRLMLLIPFSPTLQWLMVVRLQLNFLLVIIPSLLPFVL